MDSPLLKIMACLFFGILISCDKPILEEKSPSKAKPVSHELWEKLLKKYVSDEGKVNYAEWKKEGSELDKYLKILESAHPNESWSSNERKAYWINAYNAFTVKLILNHYPVKSIKDIGGALSSPWDIRFITIEGKSYHLNELEHQILRPIFKDPRIHFAINCASFSCPKLLNQAITADQIEEQLNRLAKSFLSDTKRNILKTDTVQISEIFKWFQEDFVQQGSLIDFLNQYAEIKIASNATVQYLDYNWNLNE